MFDANKHHVRAILWGCLFALVVADFCRIVVQGWPVDGDIFSLLPEESQDASVNTAVKYYQQSISNKILFFVGADEPASAKQAAELLVEKLNGSEYVSSVNGAMDNASETANSLLYKHRYQLLSSAAKEMLSQGRATELKQQSLQMLFSPLGVTDSLLLQYDPQLLFVDFLKELTESVSIFSITDHWLTRSHEGKTYFFIDVDLGDVALPMDHQIALVSDVRLIQQTVLGTSRDVSIVSVGTVYHAAAGVSQGKKEVSTVGVGSAFGVLLLLTLTFRSVVPLVLSCVAIGSGVLAALVVCFHVFGRIHVLSLVFGASLIGVTIDYAFHFYAEKNYDGATSGGYNGASALRRVLPGITLGMLTSVVAYLSMGVGPFALMQQVALFSAVGLFASFLCVVCLFPLWQGATGIVATRAKRFSSVMLALPHTAVMRHKYRVLMLVVVAMSPGVFLLTPLDDVRLLQSSPESLKSEEKRFFDIMGVRSAFQFYLVSGDTVQAALQTEEALLSKLEQLKNAGAVKRFNGITQVLPSIKTQAENYNLRRQSLVSDDQWADYYQTIGFDDDQQAAFMDAFLAQNNNQMTFDAFSASALFERTKAQWIGLVEGRYYSVVTLSNVHDVNALLDVERELTDVVWIDQVADFSSVLKEYRESTTLWVLLAYCLIAIFLMVRYGIKTGAIYMLPPMVAAWVALGAVGYVGSVFNLFNVFALILILGIGIDYVLFFAENEGAAAPTMLSITLSAITTILSFGLLALSQTNAISGFGFTMLVGISCVYFLSPMYAMKSQGDQ
ncbi:hypothetical protein A9Q99_16035 [Gammaproteobacteria bacterium 45_16_T64]|nr:hypothetical protein A9Q99_16035 [Gammaproteobacteria bacterium 45_16_T64]